MNTSTKEAATTPFLPGTIADVPPVAGTTPGMLDLIESYLGRSDWKVKENSNMAYSLQGLHHYVASAASEAYWLEKIHSPDIGQAHRRGDFHVHDLGQLSVYCVGWDLADLLMIGFGGVDGKVECAPPKHFRAALGQMANFLYTLQGEASGAQAFSNVDTLLAPFIHYDNLSQREVDQCIQEWVYNLNVPTRVGFQTPFTNITIDLKCPTHLASEPVVHGGKPQDKTYGDFDREQRMFNKALFKVLGQGDASARIFTFPIPTINVTEDFNWDDPDLEGLWQMTGTYGIPYFSNFVNSDMKPEDARSMCCRLRIDNTRLERRGGGLFGANPLTGSIGVVTLNLPRAAHLANGNKKDFFHRISQLMDLAKEALQQKRAFLEDTTNTGLYPYTKHYLRYMKQRRGQYWGNHFSTVGLVGMNEACENLLGQSITTKEGQKLAEKTLRFMRMKLLKFQEEAGNFFNLEATPAEGTSYRLARLDHANLPGCTFANTEDVCEKDQAPYYTNSTHVPVGYSEDIFEVLDHQDKLQTMYTGGTVVHLFLGEKIANTESVKKLVKLVAHRYKLPYFSITPTFSICRTHGYLNGEQPVCPHCQTPTEVYSRIVGYLRPVMQWNPGKTAEWGDRSALKKIGENPVHGDCCAWSPE